MSLDTAVNSWFLATHTPNLTIFFTASAYFCDWYFVLPVAAAWAVWGGGSSLRAYIAPLWITLVSAEAVTFILKILVARPRPLGALVVEHSYSFPSGHATIAVAMYGFLIYMIHSTVTNKLLRSTIVILTLLLILLIGLCRLYLGVHYVTDVLAGYSIGLLGIFVGIHCNRYFLVQKKALKDRQ